jgi:hypothetical protein
MSSSLNRTTTDRMKRNDDDCGDKEDEEIDDCGGEYYVME